MFTLLGKVDASGEPFTGEHAEKLIGSYLEVDSPVGRRSGMVVEAVLVDGGQAMNLRLEVDGEPDGTI